MEYELYHHGIKGQRWGIRRYQNKDGSLTAYGKKRLRQLERDDIAKAKQDKKRLKQLEKEETAKAKQSNKKKSLSDMTDDELKSAIARGRLEEEYKRYNPEKEKFSKRFIDDALKPAVVSAGKTILTNTLNKFGDMALEKAGLKTKDLKSVVDELRLKKDFNDLTDTAFNKLKRDVDMARMRSQLDKFTKSSNNDNSNPQNNGSRDSNDGPTSNTKNKTDTKEKRNSNESSSNSTSSEKSKVFEGTVSGKGTSTSSYKSKYEDGPIIDVDDYWGSSNVPAIIKNFSSDSYSSPKYSESKSIGERFIAGYLPAPRKEDD